MRDHCDLCASDTLTEVYAPTPSPRGLTVFLCGTCGLVQSLPRLDRASAPRERKISSGADWGNIRYGKGFRADANLADIRPHLTRDRALNVLDVGANRGAFGTKLIEEFPNARVIAVEPDTSVTGDWRGHPGMRWIALRIEETRFADASFDVIYSCHTIEHLRSPHATLAQHWRNLKPGGLLLLEAPDLALIGQSDIVEEFFIDKHLYHFSATTLAQLVRASGFRIIGGSSAPDPSHLTILAVKDEVPAAFNFNDPEEVARATALLADYQAIRFRNVAALVQIAKTLHARRNDKIAIWGAGRLLHCLIESGGLNPKKLAAVVDTNLSKHMDQIHGVPLTQPDALAKLNPDLVVVMSRSFAGEIANAARLRVPNAEILLYTDLIAQAKRA